MEKSNVIQEKAYAFALSIIEFYKFMLTQKEFILSKQVIRSGTGIGANIEEALQAQSRKDFISKLSIALKEAVETRYWLRLFCDSHLAPKEDIQKLLDELSPILKILTSIIKTSKEP